MLTLFISKNVFAAYTADCTIAAGTGTALHYEAPERMVINRVEDLEIQEGTLWTLNRGFSIDEGNLVDQSTSTHVNLIANDYNGRLTKQWFINMDLANCGIGETKLTYATFTWKIAELEGPQDNGSVRYDCSCRIQ